MAAATAARRDRSGLRHEASIREPRSIALRTRGQDYFFCGAPLPRTVRSRAGKIPGRRARLRAARLPAPSTPVRCIRRCGRSARAVARSAAWRWSPSRSRSTMRRDPELIDMTRRFWIALVLTLPVFVHRDGRPSRPGASACRRHGRTGFRWCLATPVVLWAGAPFFARGWRSLVTRNLNMFTLIAMGIGVAYALQRGGDAGAAAVPAGVPRHARRGRGVFRGGGRHHGAGPARAGAGIARARTHLRRDPRAARACAQDRAAHRRARRRGRRDRRDRGRRSPAGASRREDSGRRRGHRRPLVGRRIDGDRRVDAGLEGRRRARRSAAPSTRAAA